MNRLLSLNICSYALNCLHDFGKMLAFKAFTCLYCALGFVAIWESNKVIAWSVSKHSF